MAIVAGVIVWLLVRGGDEETTATKASRAPAFVSTSELQSAAASSQTPIYWAGEQSGVRYELSRSGGAVTVRYLAGDAKPGAGQAKFTSVSTYEQQDALSIIEDLARKPGTKSYKIDRGGVAYFEQRAPFNVYAAWPGEDVQVEVYEPTRGRALELVRSGKIIPVS